MLSSSHAISHATIKRKGRESGERQSVSDFAQGWLENNSFLRGQDSQVYPFWSQTKAVENCRNSRNATETTEGGEFGLFGDINNVTMVFGGKRDRPRPSVLSFLYKLASRFKLKTTTSK